MAKTDLANIDADLAHRAQNMKQRIGTAESKKITVDQKDGVLIGPGNLDLGSTARIIVVDFCNANKWYDRPYNQDNPIPPACFAFGDVLADMAPEPESPDIQNEVCATCWANEWGSDPGGGKGKACKNSRELAVVFADDLEDPEADIEMFTLSVSPTSIKSFDAAAGKIFRETGMPPIKKIMTVEVVQVGNYYNLRFGVEDGDNPYLTRVYPLLETTADILAKIPDVSKWEPIKQPKARKVTPSATR